MVTYHFYSKQCLVSREHSGKVSKKIMGNFYFLGITLTTGSVQRSSVILGRRSHHVTCCQRVLKAIPSRFSKWGTIVTFEDVRITDEGGHSANHDGELFFLFTLDAHSFSPSHSALASTRESPPHFFSWTLYFCKLTAKTAKNVGYNPSYSYFN